MILYIPQAEISLRFLKLLRLFGQSLASSASCLNWSFLEVWSALDRHLFNH